MSEERLLTIGVTVYNNAHYLPELLDSIFIQEYPSIEIVISDDGSREFKKDEIERYIENNKKENIKDYKIFPHEKNVGTVKNANFIISQATGEYFMFVAADDALYDAQVLARFVKEFERRGESCKILSASVAMCTEDVDDVVFSVPDKNAIKLIKNSTPNEMFSRLAVEYTVPAGGTCYRRELFAELNGYDEEYKLIEDGPFFIRMARLGYKFAWIDDMTVIRHRDGGICHGNKNNGSESFRKYLSDEILFFEKEVIPYQSQIREEDYREAMDKYGYVRERYYLLFEKNGKSFGERIAYLKRHGLLKIRIKNGMKRILRAILEKFRVIYKAMPQIGLGMTGLYFLCKDMYIGDFEVLGRGAILVVGTWLVLKVLSVFRWILFSGKR